MGIEIAIVSLISANNAKIIVYQQYIELDEEAGKWTISKSHSDKW